MEGTQKTYQFLQKFFMFFATYWTHTFFKNLKKKSTYQAKGMAAMLPAYPTPPYQPDTLLYNVGESWRPVLEPEFSKPYFAQLTRFVCDESRMFTVYPSAENVFSWTRACPLDQVQVVILGQNPYHRPNQAHGLSFSVLPGIPPPRSLLNIFKLLEQDIQGFQRPAHGCLQGWAEQGVLMLNSVLTVREGKSNSHAGKGWEQFTDAVIAYLNNNKDGLVFVLWGSYAQKKEAHIDKERHLVLESVHPSPLSAYKGFFECGHFPMINAYLEKSWKEPINWSHLPPFA